MGRRMAYDMKRRPAFSKIKEITMSRLQLSDRLQLVASYLPLGSHFADIGSDHAYLPCYVCSQDKTAKAIAGEINKGPFNSAVETVHYYGLTDTVEVRLGNGLHVLNNNDQIKQLVIAGMGGSLIKAILEEGKSRLGMIQRIIVQPNVDARSVRKWFIEHGFTITNESIMEERGHIYEIIVADRDGMNPYINTIKDKQLLFGPILLKDKSEVFHRKWQQEYEKLQRVIEQMKQAKQENVEKKKLFDIELQWIREVLQNDENENRK